MFRFNKKIVQCYTGNEFAEPPSYSEVESQPSVYIIDVGASIEDTPPPSYDEALTTNSFKWNQTGIIVLNGSFES